MGAGDVHSALTRVMDEDHGRLLAALIGQLRDFQLAEDCLQEALTAALLHWGRSGVPAAPAGWLLQVARRKAIDRLRHAGMAARNGADYEYLLSLDQADAGSPQDIPDDRLRLIFTCCHPALDAKSRVALTLRTLGGLTTGEIAHAFLDREAAMAQRLVRAKRKIAKAAVPYAVPGPKDWPERLPHVLTVIYLIFNEGYAASSGAVQIRQDLSSEAIFLAELVNDLRPGESEVEGLLALMLLIDARRAARNTAAGAMIALEDQDRSLWDRDRITRGSALVERALRRHRPGPYQVQAAIQAVHAEADGFAQTDWAEILGLYDVLLRFEDTPVVRLNRAVALAELHGAAPALQLLQPLRGALADYAPYFAAEAELLGRLGQGDRSVAAYDRAIELTPAKAERDFLIARRNRLKKRPSKSSA